MFLRRRRHRSRNSAISKISSYINPAQKHEARKHVLEATPTAPIPQCHSPAGFLKQKAYVFVSTQPPESNLEAPGPGHPKHEAKKHVLEATPAAPSPSMPQPCPFSEARSLCFRMHSNSGTEPPGPRLWAQTPWAQGTGFIGPRAEAPALRAQGPSSELQNLVPTAWGSKNLSEANKV